MKNKSTFGRVTPLGQPRSVYKSDVECCFLKFRVKMAKWPWRSRSINRIFNTSCGDSKMHVVQIWWMQVKSIIKLSHGQVKFLSQNGQNNLEGQGQGPPFSIPVENIPGCMLGTNLVIVAPTHYKLSCRQTKFPRILSQNDLEAQGQRPPFSIPIESIPRCMFGTNLVIVAPIHYKLSRRQAKFPKSSESKWPKWPWRSRSMISIFNTN